MRWEQKVQYATISDIGMRRKNNQDSMTVQLCSERETWQRFGHLFIVADGMGGHAVGELASKIAVDTIPLTFFKSRSRDVEEALVEAIENANAAIYERGTQNHDFKRMGTTCVALVLTPQGAITGHVGDSRCYRIRQGRIEQLTFDHSLQWEMQRAGRIKPGDVFLPDAKHVITRSLGPESKVQVDINGPHPILPGDRFVLCSDGLTGHISDSEIGMVVRELPPNESSRLLVNLANLRGGSDNVTVIVAEAGRPPQTATDDEPLEDAPSESVSSVGPFWTMAFWLTFLVFGIGAIMLTTDHIVEGRIFAGVGLTGFLLVIRHYLNHQPVDRQLEEDDTTVDSKTYRVASARPTKEFMAGLAKMENELRRIASEESWEIDWSAHASAIESARVAVDARKTRRAMSELGKAIDLLVVGLHAHRKKTRSPAAARSGQPSGEQA